LFTAASRFDINTIKLPTYPYRTFIEEFKFRFKDAINFTLLENLH